MNNRLMIAMCSAVLLGFAATLAAPVSAQEKGTKSCDTQWRGMNKDERKGLKKKLWVAECLAKAGGGSATASAAGEAKEKTGRATMIARLRTCAEQWREAKAAGLNEKGQSWPKYWSACNKRLKEQSA